MLHCVAMIVRDFVSEICLFKKQKIFSPRNVNIAHNLLTTGIFLLFKYSKQNLLRYVFVNCVYPKVCCFRTGCKILKSWETMRTPHSNIVVSGNPEIKKGKAKNWNWISILINRIFIECPNSITFWLKLFYLIINLSSDKILSKSIFPSLRARRASYGKG